MKLEEPQIYQLAIDIAEKIWNIVIQKDYFAKAAKKQFCYYSISRGSLYETKTCLKKSHNRNLVTDENFHSIQKDLDKIAIKLSHQIDWKTKRQRMTTYDLMTA